MWKHIPKYKHWKLTWALSLELSEMHFRISTKSQLKNQLHEEL